MESKFKKGRAYREMTIETEISEDERSFEISFSSETPVVRWGEQEILDHAPEAVDLSRLQTMGIVLFNHDCDQVLGKISDIRIENGRGLAKITFDDDDEALRIFNKVKNGTLRGISVGYMIQEYIYVPAGTQTKDGRFVGACVVVTRWQPYEVSVVSVPADETVGIGRADETGYEHIISAAAERSAQETQARARTELHKEKLRMLESM